MIEFIFQATLHGLGDTYLAAEAELIEKKEKAGPFLTDLPSRENPWERQVVELLRQRVAGNPDFIACLEFLDRTEQETAPTVKGEPSPEWVGARLFQDFGPRAATLLGVYLVKLEEIWPYWKTAGSLLYLERLPGRDSRVHLLELILRGKSGQFRAMARKALLAKPDAALLALVEQRLAKAEESAAVLRQLAEELRPLQA